MRHWFWLCALGALLAQPPEESLNSWKLVRTVEIQGDLHHVQGIDVEGDQLWVSSVDRRQGKGFLYRISLSDGATQGSVEVQDGKKIHPGGIERDGDSIWVPVAEYDRDGPTNIEKRNKKTLARESAFLVNDHIGCVAAARDRLVGGSWSSRTIYTWSKDGKELDRRANPSPTEWQDLKMDGALLMGAGNQSRNAGAVEWLTLPDLTLVRRLRAGVTDRGLPMTNEGMTYREGRLYFLPEDAPSRLFIYAKN